MTGDEVIALARANFGEATPLTVSTQTARDYLNSACQELFDDLPAERMRNRITVDTVVIASGKGELLDTWDRIVEVLVNDQPAQQVPKEVINAADFGTEGYFIPTVPIFHIDDRSLWVRPTSPGAVKVEHLTPPPEITDTTAEITVFNPTWHLALAILITAYMYAQEEDLTQAQHYKSQYLSFILQEGVSPSEAEASQ